MMRFDQASLSRFVVASMLLSWARSSYRQGASSQCSQCYLLHVACLSFSSSLLSPSWSIHRAKCHTRLLLQRVSLSFVLVSTNTNIFLFEFYTSWRRLVSPTPSCTGEWDPWSVPANVKCSCGIEAETGFVIGTLLRCGSFLDTEISILHWLLQTSCVNVLLSWSCSQPIRQRIHRRTAVLDFNFR